MPALVPENGNGLVNSNTYVDQAYADSYFSNLGVTVWDTFTQDEKETYLYNAAAVLDNKYGTSYRGDIYSNTQAMLFPRTSFDDTNGRYVAAKTIPTALKNAQCQFALYAGEGISLYVDPNRDSVGISSESSSVGRGAVTESVSYFTNKSSATYQTGLTLLRPVLISQAFTGYAVRG